MQEKIIFHKLQNQSKSVTEAKNFINDYDQLKDKKIQTLEDEINVLRQNILERDKELERVQTMSSPSKNLNKAKSTVSRLRYFIIMIIFIFSKNLN